MKPVYSAVMFQTDNSKLQRLYDTAECKLNENIKYLAGRSVLIEGGDYHKIWL